MLKTKWHLLQMMQSWMISCEESSAQTKAAKLKQGCVGVEDPSEGGGGGFMSPEQRKVEELSKDVGYQRPESERLYLGSGLN